jgi:hypothetical protein
MTNPTFWLALAGITVFGLLWIRFCGWLTVKVMEWMGGESEAPAVTGAQVKQANTKGA